MSVDRTRYLTIKEAATLLGYSYIHVYRLVNSGAVASIEISDHVRLVDMVSFQAYIAAKPQRKPHQDK